MMAHPHSVVNNYPLPGPMSPPTTRLSSFPNLGFVEHSGDITLDLNSSQKLSQHTMKAPNTFSSDQQEFEVSQSSHQDLGLGGRLEMVVSEGVLDFSPDKAVHDGPAKITQRSRCHWSHNEIMALFNAKKSEADNEETENEKVGGKKVRAPPERWDEVAEFCKAMGSNKSASQCKEKWERIWLAFRKIIDWEKQTPLGKPSFWAMQGEEREKEGFPRTFDRELFDAMAVHFGFLKSIELASNVVDSSGMGVAEDASTDNGAELQQNPAVAFEESPSTVDDQAPWQKRKAPPPPPPHADSGEPAPPKGKKKRKVYGVYKAEKVEQKGGTKAFKSKANDFDERKLLLEERKVKLAEKRFQLEERKLEATVEIGKGLIASMERMTQTISSLGAFSSH